MSVDRKHLSKRRRTMGNPYAHIEQLIDSETRELSEQERIHRARLGLQNPYAFLDGSGRFSVVQSDSNAKSKRNSFEYIELLVTNIQRKLWMQRSSIWSDGMSKNPVEVLDAAEAAKLFGFTMDFVGILGLDADKAQTVAVAGLIDRSANRIEISRDFDPPVRNFTAAHELGHAVLHADTHVFHRDLPIDGSRLARDRVELEADKFATYFLLPEKQVRKEFLDRYLTTKFVLTDDTAFALLNKPFEVVSKELSARRKLSRFLAAAIKYNGRHFYSLAEHFNVTAETLAIRLEELELV